MKTGHAELLVCFLLTLPACSSLDYEVEVRNETARTVRAELRMEQLANPALLASDSVPPGQSVWLGPVKTAPFDSVELRVSTGELGGVDSHARLRRGKSTAVVEGDAWGSVRVRVE